MKISAVLFVFGLVVALAVPHSSIELEESSENDEFIRSPDSPTTNARELLGKFGHQVRLGVRKVSENVEKLLNKRSQATVYLKTIGENGKNKIVQLFYVDSEDESGRRIPTFFISDIFGKLKDYLNRSNGLENVKTLVEKMFEKGDSIVRSVLYTLKTKGQEVVTNLLNRMPGQDEEPPVPERTATQGSSQM